MNIPTCKRKRQRARRGLSLLEVILAIAILGGSIAMIGELIRIGARSGSAARDVTTAQLLCETKLNEIVAGILPVEPTPETLIDSVEITEPWYYAVDVQPIDEGGMLAVQVIVSKPAASNRKPISFSLIRWMIDPELEYELATGEVSESSEESEETEEELSSGGTSGSSSGGTGGSSSGGNGAASGGGRNG